MKTHRNNSRVTDRDIDVLRGLFECRVLTLGQIALMQFAGRGEAAKKRIQTLKRAKLIAERPRARNYERSILFLTKAGFSMLRSGGHVRDFPKIDWDTMEKRVRVSPLTLAHELSVNHIKAIMTAAMRNQPGLTLVEFLTWPRLFSFKANTDTGDAFGHETVIRPDGFVRIEQSLADEVSTHLAYLEVDRSTETLDTLRMKVLGYMDHFRSGGMAARLGRPRAEYKSSPFRVLFVLNNDERRNNLAEALLTMHRPVLQLAWLTTLDAILADPLGPIWLRPIDYRTATTATQYEPRTRLRGEVYRRDPTREAFVANALELKHFLTAKH